MSRACAVLLLAALAGTPALAQPSITGARVDCINGEAAGHPCHNVALLSRLMPRRLDANIVLDMWGWTDGATGREYALVTTDTAVAFVDISDPINPLYLGLLPSRDSTVSDWRDVKVYQDHAFVVMDVNGANGMQVFDLTQLRAPPQVPHTFSETAHYDQFEQAHNLAINTATGYAYVVGSNNGPCPKGLHMVDIRTPLQPAYAGCFIDSSTGNSGDGYTHDAQCVVYHGPDSDYAGREICIGANVKALSIADVSDKSLPVQIASAVYPDPVYTHQAWLTEDHRYLFVNDETDELLPNWLNLPPLPGTRTLIWDLEDLDDPVFVREYFGPTDASDHNLYIRGDTLYMANYAAGLRIADISDPSDPVEIAFFDTYAHSDIAGLFGAWTAYPYFKSGTVAVTSENHGLYLLVHDAADAAKLEPQARTSEPFAFSAAYPNPFSTETSLTLHNPVAQQVLVTAFDVSGRRVAILHDGTLAAGTHTVHFDGQRLPGGTYLILGTSPNAQAARAVTLAK